MSKRILLILSALSCVAFFVFSTWAMQHYPGGTLHNRASEGYDFWRNFFSDLGRTRAWNGQSNTVSNAWFKAAMWSACAGLSTFFVVLPSLFPAGLSRRLAVAASVLGIVAALCYLGIVAYPLNVDYQQHTIFVRAGFIAFLLMSGLLAGAIYQTPTYPDRYAHWLMLFGLLLGVQVAIMLLGPRSWHSPRALLLQASAQKVVVYAQIVAMLVQVRGAWRLLGTR